jgi:hypothetical protein
MRPLILDEIQKAKVKEVVDFARTNLYYPFKSETIPGDDARHVVNIPVGYRCVFSITVTPDGKHWRHLSISVPKREKYPHPAAACVIADLFGFTGYDADHPSETPPRDWLMSVNKEDNCVVLAQELRKAAE